MLVNSRMILIGTMSIFVVLYVLWLGFKITIGINLENNLPNITREGGEEEIKIEDLRNGELLNEDNLMIPSVNNSINVTNIYQDGDLLSG